MNNQNESGINRFLFAFSFIVLASFDLAIIGAYLGIFVFSTAPAVSISGLVSLTAGLIIGAILGFVLSLVFAITFSVKQLRKWNFVLLFIFLIELLSFIIVLKRSNIALY